MPEEAVGTTEELSPDQPLEVEVNGTRVLVVRAGGGIHAVGAECPHAGGNLADGNARNGHIRCPWHHAEFDLTTGQLEEPPSLNAIPHFDVRVEDGTIYVDVPDEVEKEQEPRMCAQNISEDDRLFVIVGGGAAAAAAAETLRQRGFAGRLMMITREPLIPYDRTKLSKSYLMIPGGESFPPSLRSEEFYDRHDIAVRTDTEVIALNPDDQTITLADGEQLRYDAALMATGSRPRRLDPPGSELDNIFYLRSVNDADRIREGVAGAESAVIVGASFIGMEAAAGLVGQGLEVTVVAPEPQPFALTLGEEVGSALRSIHEEKGVQFRMGHVIDEIRGSDRVEAVELDNGKRLDADLVVFGVGVVPETGYVMGLDLREDGSVPVDQHLQAADNLYAAGDIAAFPSPQTGEDIRVEHWRLALQHGRVAAANMAGAETAYEDVPFFWTDQHHNMVRYVGHAPDWDEVIIDGDLEEKQFIAFYVNAGRIAAAAGLNRDHEMTVVAECMRSGEMPAPDELEDCS